MKPWLRALRQLADPVFSPSNDADSKVCDMHMKREGPAVSKSDCPNIMNMPGNDGGNEMRLVASV